MTIQPVPDQEQIVDRNDIRCGVGSFLTPSVPGGFVTKPGAGGVLFGDMGCEMCDMGYGM
jgi:hypothetical protein